MHSSRKQLWAAENTCPDQPQRSCWPYSEHHVGQSLDVQDIISITVLPGSQLERSNEIFVKGVCRPSPCSIGPCPATQRQLHPPVPTLPFILSQSEPPAPTRASTTEHHHPISLCEPCVTRHLESSANACTLSTWVRAVLTNLRSSFSFFFGQIFLLERLSAAHMLDCVHMLRLCPMGICALGS